MTKSKLPSVGGRDMQDLRGVSRRPAMALLQSWSVPQGPRPKDEAKPAAAQTAAQTAFQALRAFSPGDYVNQPPGSPVLPCRAIWRAFRPHLGNVSILGNRLDQDRADHTACVPWVSWTS